MCLDVLFIKHFCYLCDLYSKNVTFIIPHWHIYRFLEHINLSVGNAKVGNVLIFSSVRLCIEFSKKFLYVVLLLYTFLHLL